MTDLPVFSFQVRMRDLAGSSHKYDGTRIYTTTVHFYHFFYVLCPSVHIHCNEGVISIQHRTLFPLLLCFMAFGTYTLQWRGNNIYTTAVHFSHFFYVLWPSVHIHCNEGVISIQPPYTFSNFFMFHVHWYIYIVKKGTGVCNVSIQPQYTFPTSFIVLCPSVHIQCKEFEGDRGGKRTSYILKCRFNQPKVGYIHSIKLPGHY